MPHEGLVGRLAGDQRDIELAGLQQRNVLVAALGVARLDRNVGSASFMTSAKALP